MEHGADPPLAPLDPADDFCDLGAALDEVAALLERASGDLATRRPEVSGWSPAEHAFHVTLAAELCLKNLHSLVAGQGLLVRPLGKRLPEALALLRESEFPRGQAQAPRFVRPPSRVDLDVLRGLLAEVRAAYVALSEHVAGLAELPLGVPHQVLGDLNAVEWLRFARVHTRHHLAIVDDLLAYSPPASASRVDTSR